LSTGADHLRRDLVEHLELRLGELEVGGGPAQHDRHVRGRRAERERVGPGAERRRVDDHRVELRGERHDELLHPRRRQQLGAAAMARAR
jgi:hypothetical protein